jgi:hypothetical protein
MTDAGLLQTAKEIILDIEARFIQMGKILRTIHERESWREGYESFDNPAKHNFIEELGLTKTLANRLMNIHVKLGTVPEHKLIEAGKSKLFEVLPYVGRETPEKLVDISISAPSEGELRKMLKHEYGEPKPQCAHEETYSLTICRGCGDRTSENTR